MLKIGIQGGPGSFSEIAAKTFLDRMDIQAETDYLISSENVLTAVEKKNADFGIFAIENAKGGVVIESIKALAKHQCDIVDMFPIEVDQNLLVLPGTKMTDIKSIHSHRQALRQCRDYLANHFWGCDLVEENDTADSARRLKTGDLPSNAAVIANKACSELYQLEILEASIHDLKNNLTTFLVIKHLDA